MYRHGTEHCRARTRYATAQYVISVFVARKAPPEWVIDAVHVFNLVFRLAMLVLGIVVYSGGGFNSSPALTVAEYRYAAWDDVAGPGDVPPGPLIIVPAGGQLLGAVWFMLTTACLLGDGERFLSKVCGVRTNRIDYVWHFIMAVISPLLVLLVALMLGTHNIPLLVATTVLWSFTVVIAQLAENICKLVNLEEGNGSGFTSIALPMLRSWHDWILTLTTMLVLYPFICNIVSDRSQVSTLQIMLGVCLVCLSLSLATIQHGHHRFLKRVQRTWPCKLLREYESSEAALLASGAETRPSKLQNLLRKLTAPRLDRGEELYENLYGTRVYSQHQHPASGGATTTTAGRGGPDAAAAYGRDVHPASSPTHSFKWNCYKDMPDDAFNRLYGCQVVAGTAITAPPKYTMNADLQYVPCTGLRGRDALAPRHNPYTVVDTHDEDARCARMRVMYLVEWRRHYVLNLLINTILIASLFELDAMGGSSSSFAADVTHAPK